MRLSLLFCLICSAVVAQDWHADHFYGYPVPTLVERGDVATLPIPHPGSNIRLVSTLTTTNTPALLGDLSGRTIVAVVSLEYSNSPVFYFNNDCGNGVPANMRLFFTTDQRPYNVNHANANETDYWWSDTAWYPIEEGTNLLIAIVNRAGWSDALGHYASDPNYTAAFQDAAKHVAQIGLSFGGGCFFDNGVGIANTGTSATLHVLEYDLLSVRKPPSKVKLKANEFDNF